MNATPLICPHCGELVIAWTAGTTIIIPVHTDRIMPVARCTGATTPTPVSR